MSAAERRRFDLDAGAISYIAWPGPDDAPPLHLAHANGFNGLTYRHLLSPLADAFRLRAWDARGHGRTTLPADPERHRNWYVYRDDLERFVEAWAEETGQPVILAGHSMGGTASVLLAARRPDLVRGLVLLDPVIMPWLMQRLLRFGESLAPGLGPNPLAAAAERRRAHWPDAAHMLGAYRGRGAFRTWPDDVLADYIEGGTVTDENGELRLACDPLWEAANFRAHGHDTWGAILTLRVPFMLLNAEHGSTTMAFAPTAFRLRDAQAEIARVPGTTHFLPMEKPNEIRAAMLRFRERLSGG